MDKDDIAALFAVVRPVEVKRMFGGHGVFRDGLMFALEIRGDLFLKADAVFAEEMEAMGAARLGYEARGRRVDLPYWTLPDAALDDEDLRDGLFRRALDVARAMKASPARRKRSKAAAGNTGAPPPDLDLLGVGGGLTDDCQSAPQDKLPPKPRRRT